ncbi:Protein kinase-like domain [Pseudocohnilembus persalinus]|uniref:Protein kinase-like domain n=1 Tax=Pseudocohnilembus persalinus TaxID=266149 RepID=A0A0V0QI34_PSEPJ|nr:Protein kinase-like domain [Pseudocohnilembus persalinus]|eukprot:KRX01846.1 Protein kinase-like domain [Pseudocohnilembus persalinus]
MVSKVFQDNTDGNIAIKVINTGDSQYYFKEKQILEKIKNDNITPKILQFKDDELSIYMEKGQYTLHDQNMKKKEAKEEWTENEIYSFIRQMFKYIKKLDKKGIFHSDLKQDNILIMKNGDLKLIDFGSACEDPKDYIRVLKQNNLQQTQQDLRVKCVLSEIQQIIKIARKFMCNILAFKEKMENENVYQPSQNQQKEQYVVKTLTEYYPNLVQLLKQIKECQNVEEIQKCINYFEFNVVNQERKRKKKVDQIILEAKRKEELARNISGIIYEGQVDSIREKNVNKKSSLKIGMQKAANSENDNLNKKKRSHISKLKYVQLQSDPNEQNQQENQDDCELEEGELKPKTIDFRLQNKPLKELRIYTKDELKDIAQKHQSEWREKEVVKRKKNERFGAINEFKIEKQQG